MLGPVASSSRSVLARAASAPAAEARRAVRTFASSSRATERLVTIDIAHRSTSFVIPTIGSLIDKVVASLTGSQQMGMPALAGISDGSGLSAIAEEDAAGTEQVLDWDGLLHAVPKSRVSHSRKRMRSANKGLKDRLDIVHCPGCGRPKAAHHICAHCYNVIAREQKAAKRTLEAQRAARAERSEPEEGVGSTKEAVSTVA